MKTFYSIFFLVLIYSTSQAQIEGESLKILEKVVRNFQPDGKLVYTDKITNTEILKIKMKLKSSSITGVSKDTKQNFIVLTRQEKKLLNDQFDLLSYAYWSADLFTNSLLIKEDTLSTYFKSQYAEYAESFSNPNNSTADQTTILKNYVQPNVLEFSNPIFLRDNSICLLYVKKLCGNPCGYGELTFYKKEGTNWNKWIVVSEDTY